MANYDDIFKNVPTKADKTFEPFDKTEWAEMKQIEREYAFATIEETLENIKSSPEDYRNFLDVMSKFEKYSTGNILLIANQMPEATKLMDSKAISKTEGFVLKGERGIVLLEPGEEFKRKDGTTGVSFKTKKVFDISQTFLEDNGSGHKYENRMLLKALINNAPCRFEIVPELENGMYARYDPKSKMVYIKENLKAEDIFRALSQEISFAHLHKSGKDRGSNVFTAYSCAYVICQKYGFDVSNFNFSKLPDDFKDMENKDVRKELDKVRNIVNEITGDMARAFEKQKADRDAR